DGIRDTSVTVVQTCALPIYYERAQGSSTSDPRQFPDYPVCVCVCVSVCVCVCVCVCVWVGVWGGVVCAVCVCVCMSGVCVWVCVWVCVCVCVCGVFGCPFIFKL